MSEKSISMMLGKGSLNHNRRKFYTDNVDPSRTAENVCLCDKNIRKVYHELFDDAVVRYNERQTRADRKIEDYYEKLRSGKQEKPFHELIVQIGNCQDTPVGSMDAEKVKEVLLDYAKSFFARNRSLYVIQCYIHMDEATPHLHLDFVPFVHTTSGRGLDTRVSLKQALKSLGFVGKDKRNTEWALWANSEKDHLATIMKEHGFEWKKKDTHRPHLSVLDYKVEQRKIELEQLDEESKRLRRANEELENEAVFMDGHLENASELLQMITIFDEDDAREGIQQITEWMDEVYQFVGEQESVMYELETKVDSSEEELRVAVKDALFVWQRVFYALQDLIKRINEVVRGLLLYGVFVKHEIEPQNVVTLHDRIRTAKERAASSKRSEKEEIACQQQGGRYEISEKRSN